MVHWVIKKSFTPLICTCQASSANNELVTVIGKPWAAAPDFYLALTMIELIWLVASVRSAFTKGFILILAIDLMWMIKCSIWEAVKTLRQSSYSLHYTMLVN